MAMLPISRRADFSWSRLSTAFRNASLAISRLPQSENVAVSMYRAKEASRLVRTNGSSSATIC